MGENPDSGLEIQPFYRIWLAGLEPDYLGLPLALPYNQKERTQSCEELFSDFDSDKNDTAISEKGFQKWFKAGLVSNYWREREIVAGILILHPRSSSGKCNKNLRCIAG